MYLDFDNEQFDNFFELEFEQTTEVSDGGFDRGYKEGYAKGDEDGKIKGRAEGQEIGYADALAKRTNLVVTANGDYTPTDDSTGFKSVSVQVQSKLSQIADGTVTVITAEDLRGATSIRDYLFYEANSIKTLEIPNSVKSIGYRACQNCRNTTLSFEKNSTLSTIGNEAFESVGRNVTEFKKLVIPDSVTVIGGSAFRGCATLESITLSNSLTKFGQYSFAYCSALKRIEIPSSVVTLNAYMFYKSNALEEIVFPDDCVITSFPTDCFYSIEGITSFTVPASVTTINARVWQNCKALKTLIMKRAAPPYLANSSAFQGCDALEEIIVPRGCGDAYKSATNWSAHASKIVEGDV